MQIPPLISRPTTNPATTQPGRDLSNISSSNTKLSSAEAVSTAQKSGNSTIIAPIKTVSAQHIYAAAGGTERKTLAVDGVVVGSGKLDNQTLNPKTLDKLPQGLREALNSAIAANNRAANTSLANNSQPDNTAAATLKPPLTHWVKVAVTQQNSLLVLANKTQMANIQQALQSGNSTLRLLMNAEGQVQLASKSPNLAGSANPSPQAAGQPIGRPIVQLLMQLPAGLEALKSNVGQAALGPTSKGQSSLAQATTTLLMQLKSQTTASHAASHISSNGQAASTQAIAPNNASHNGLTNITGSLSAAAQNNNPVRASAVTPPSPSIQSAHIQSAQAQAPGAKSISAQSLNAHFSSKTSHNNSAAFQPSVVLKAPLPVQLTQLQNQLSALPLSLKQQLLPPKLIAPLLEAAIKPAASEAENKALEAAKILGTHQSHAAISALQHTASLTEKLAGDAILSALSLIFKQLPKSQNDAQGIKQSRAAIARWLNQEANQQLARTALNQAANLASATTHLDRQEGLNLQQEIPVKFDSGYGQLHLRIEERPHSDDRNTPHKNSERNQQSQWQVALSLALPDNSMLDAEIRLQDQSLDAHFWLENAALAEAAAEALPQFKQALKDDGLAVNQLECDLGRAPQPKTQLQQTLVDIKT